MCIYAYMYVCIYVYMYMVASRAIWPEISELPALGFHIPPHTSPETTALLSISAPGPFLVWLLPVGVRPHHVLEGKHRFYTDFHVNYFL